MSKLQLYLKSVDAALNKEKPNTYEALLSCINKVPGGENYGYHVKIVEYFGALQGVRVYVSAKTKSHPLPSKSKVYSVFKGLEPLYEAQMVEYDKQ